MLIQMKSKFAKFLIYPLFGLLILSFAVWGIGDIFRGGGQVTAVAKVGDVTIEQQEFSNQLNRELTRLQQQIGSRLTLEQARAFGVVDQVLDQMVNRALLDQQAQRLGLVISDEQVKAEIASEPAFRNQLGNFDSSQFYRILQANNLSEASYVQSLRGDLRRRQLTGMIEGAPEVPETLAEALYTYREERRVAQVLLVPIGTGANVEDPDQATIESFYQAHSDRYMAPEIRSVTYVWLRPEDLATEIAVSEDELQREFEVRRSELAVPERRSLEQMVFDEREAAEQAKQRIEAGESFAAVSQDSLGRDPIAIGTFSRSELEAQLPVLAEAAFSLSEAEVSEPVEGPLGWHLLTVTAIEPAKEPDFAEARDQLAETIRQAEATEQIIALANRLDDEIASGSTLEEAAESLGLKLHTQSALDAQGRDAGGNAVADLPSGPFLSTLSQTEPGEDSLLVETGDGGYFMLRVDGVQSAAPKPLEAARDQVIADWKRDQAEQAARERAETVAERLRDGEDLTAVAEAEDLVHATTQPLTRLDPTSNVPVPSRELPAKLFEIGPSEVTVAAGQGGFLVARLSEINAPEAGGDAETLDRLKQTLRASLEGDLLAGYYNALRQRYDVTVNQRVIDDLTNVF